MTIHWCGAGLSAIPGLRRLIKEEYDVVVWNRTLAKATAAIGDITNKIRVFDKGYFKIVCKKVTLSYLCYQQIGMCLWPH